jgi:hypothetical protein
VCNREGLLGIDGGVKILNIENENDKIWRGQEAEEHQ